MTRSRNQVPILRRVIDVMLSGAVIGWTWSLSQVSGGGNSKKVIRVIHMEGQPLLYSLS